MSRKKHIEILESAVARDRVLCRGAAAPAAEGVAPDGVGEGSTPAAVGAAAGGGGEGSTPAVGAGVGGGREGSASAEVGVAPAGGGEAAPVDAPVVEQRSDERLFSLYVAFLGSIDHQRDMRRFETRLQHAYDMARDALAFFNKKTGRVN